MTLMFSPPRVLTRDQETRDCDRPKVFRDGSPAMKTKPAGWAVPPFGLNALPTTSSKLHKINGYIERDVSRKRTRQSVEYRTAEIIRAFSRSWSHGNEKPQRLRSVRHLGYVETRYRRKKEERRESEEFCGAWQLVCARGAGFAVARG